MKVSILSHGLLLGGLTVVGANLRQETIRLPERDPRLWAEIARAVQAVDEEQQQSALDRLRSLGGPDFQDLVPQLFLFSKDATDTREGMAFGVIVEQLRIPDTAIVRSMVPLLDLSDVRSRQQVENVLSEFEDRSADRPPDFGVYRSFIEEKVRSNQEPPAGLVRHLYDVDAGTALLLMMRIHTSDVDEQKGILWAEHVVADDLWKERFGFLGKGEALPEALDQLNLLAAHSRWWARLYTAAVMKQHPALLRAETLETLRRDGHPLVRELASAAWERTVERR